MLNKKLYDKLCNSTYNCFAAPTFMSSIEPCKYFEPKMPNGVVGFITDEPTDEPFAIIIDGGMTAVVWEDGTVTKTHCQSGDQFDPMFGIMACIIRKLTKNHGHAVDEYEDRMRTMAQSISKPEDVTALIEYIKPLMDMLSVLEDSKDLWMEQLGPRPEDPTPKAEEPKAKERKPYANLKEYEHQSQEELRQFVRWLVDEGEL